MTDKRQKATKVKCKRDESLTKQSKYSPLEEAFEFSWSLFADEHNTYVKSTRRNIELKNLNVEPVTTRYIMQTLIYVISMGFLSLSHRRSRPRNIPSCEEWWEMAVFAG